jgi:hypothetical protein
MSKFTPIRNTSGSVTYSVEDGSSNNQTSLALIGRNSTGYTQTIGENFLHLLENFASFEKNSNLDSTSGPKNPIKGQLWFNLTANSGLKVFNGTNWTALSIVKKSSIDPTKNTSPTRPEDGLEIGDFYVDTVKQQLYIYGGSNKWNLVGPQYTKDDMTIVKVDLLIDAADNREKPVLSIYINKSRVAIVSDIEFTPKTTELGFPIIKRGINLNSSKTSINKFWGISEKAESLIVGDTVVSSENFLRSDQESTTKYGFYIRNNNGLLVGNDLSMVIKVDDKTGVFYNKNTNSKIKFNIQKTTGEKNVLTVDSGDVNLDTGYVGINKTNPQKSLDVNGDIQSSGSLIINNENDSDIPAPNIQSIYSKGGAFITKSVSIGKNLSVDGVSNLKNVLPKVNNAYDLGSPGDGTPLNPARKWNNIWANNIDASNITGYLNGDISGNAKAAESLTSGINIKFIGDIVLSNSLNSYNLNSPGLKEIPVAINQDFIFNRPPINNFADGDFLLVSRQTPTTGRVLSKINKFDLFKTLPVVPIGTLLLWANTQIPLGYRICDGSILNKSEYLDLFNALGATPFIDSASITRFRLPDLRYSVPDPELDASSTVIYKFNYIVFTGRFI